MTFVRRSMAVMAIKVLRYLSRRVASVGDFCLTKCTHNDVSQNFYTAHHLPYMNNCISEQDPLPVRKEAFHNFPSCANHKCAHSGVQSSHASRQFTTMR